MVESDKPTFVAVLNGLAAIKPGAKLTPEALDVWWSALREWPLGEFRAAAAHLAKSVEFMPNPFHFEEIRKAAKQTAAEAWTLVLGNVRRSDYHRGLTVGGRTDLVIRSMGGYHAVGAADPAFTHAWERRFHERWKMFTESEEARHAVPSLAPADAKPALHSGTGPKAIGDVLDRLGKVR